MSARIPGLAPRSVGGTETGRRDRPEHGPEAFELAAHGLQAEAELLRIHRGRISWTAARLILEAGGHGSPDARAGDHFSIQNRRFFSCPREGAEVTKPPPLTHRESYPPARSTSVRSRMFTPRVHASGVEYSRGLWLIPSYSPGTKIIAVGHSAAISCAS